MNDEIKFNSIVIKNMPVGEYDRLVTLLTLERGKISAFARGARRQGSQLSALTLPFTTGTFSLYPGRSSYTIKGAEVSEYFSDLKEDLEGSSYGSYVMEVADYYTVENSRDEEMMKLVFRTLKALRDKRIPVKLIRYIFELRSMVCEGEFPGVIPDIKNTKMLDAPAAHAIDHICTVPLNRLYAFNLQEESLLRLGRAADVYRRTVWDRVPKSLAVIESLENVDL